MKFILRAVLMAVLTSVLSQEALAAPAKTEAERIKIIQSLAWQTGGGYRLETSRSTLRVDERYALLVSRDAHLYVENINGVAFTQMVEAVIVDPTTHSYVVYQPFTEGYVSFDGWDEFDTQAMLEEIKLAAIETNKQRVASGIPPVTITGWKVMPALDKAKHEVSWAIETIEGGQKTVNAVALVFGRHGYEKLTWVGSSDEDPAVMLAAARSFFAYEEGAAYTDYVKGDKVAPYEISALVATVAGAKPPARFELSLFLLSFLYKSWILLLLIPIFMKERLLKLYRYTKLRAKRASRKQSMFGKVS